MTKRDRTLIINTSDEDEPPKKINTLPCLSPKTRTGLDLVDSDGVSATRFGVPAASGGGERTSPLSPLPMAEQHAYEESLAQQNILAGNQGAKHTRTLKKSDEDAPRKNGNKGCDAINKEVPTTAPLPMSANGGTPHANREFREQPREEPYAFESPVNARAKAELFFVPSNSCGSA